MTSAKDQLKVVHNAIDSLIDIQDAGLGTHQIGHVLDELNSLSTILDEQVEAG